MRRSAPRAMSISPALMGADLSANGLSAPPKNTHIKTKTCPQQKARIAAGSFVCPVLEAEHFKIGTYRRCHRDPWPVRLFGLGDRSLFRLFERLP